MTTLYLDMDGVLCNFHKAYSSLRTHAADGKRFRAAVMDFHIFEDLEFMSDAHVLLAHVAKLHDVHVEILTSLGTFDAVQGSAAKTQKTIWLNKHNIVYKPNFVRSKEEKAKYATPTSILIDDSVGCINPFNHAGGHGILHASAIETISILDSTISNIRALGALRC